MANATTQERGTKKFHRMRQVLEEIYLESTQVAGEEGESLKIDWYYQRDRMPHRGTFLLARYGKKDEDYHVIWATTLIRGSGGDIPDDLVEEAIEVFKRHPEIARQISEDLHKFEAAVLELADIS
jgi:hypothetical protein